LRACRDGGGRLGGLRRARPRRRAQPAEPLARRRHPVRAPRMTAMTYGSWLCLLAPLGGAILITLLGTRIPRVAAAWLATTSVFVAFGGAIWAFLGVHSQSNTPQGWTGYAPLVHPGRGEITTAWTWLQSGHFHAGLSLLVDPL